LIYAASLSIGSAVDDPVSPGRTSHRDARPRVVQCANHLFEEPGALAEVARLAAGWFRDHGMSR
jgi:hypothetical protein